MRRLIFASVSLIALSAAAEAADLFRPAPVYAAPVALAPIWGGFYIGMNGGYGGNSGLDFQENVFFPNGAPPAANFAPAPPPAPPFVTVAPRNPFSVLNGTDTIAGGFGGGQIGYNFQFGSLVLGIEADLEGSGIRGEGSQSIINPLRVTPPFPGPFAFSGGVPGPAGVCQNTTLRVDGATFTGGFPAGACVGTNSLDVDWFGTVRGRLGYAFGNVLLYGTGGFAAGGVKVTNTYTDNNVALPVYRAVQPPVGVGLADVFHPQVATVSKSATNTGWTAGGGIEVKISPNWSLKGEYQFLNLGRITTDEALVTIPTSTIERSPCTSAAAAERQRCLHLTSSKDVEFHTVRVGLNYYFNAPPEPLPLK